MTSRRLASMLLCTTLLLAGPAGCGDDDDNTSTADGGAGCTARSLRLALAAANLDLTCTKVNVERRDDEVVGFYGTSTNNERFWFGLFGDSPGFVQTTIYDAADEGYHMLLTVWPGDSGSSCAASSQCQTYVGLSGSWTVTSLAVPFAATFEISTLVDSESCWTETADGVEISGCTAVAGTVTGCIDN